MPTTVQNQDGGKTSGAPLKSDEQLAAKHLQLKCCEYFCPSEDAKSGMDAASCYCSGFGFFFLLSPSVCFRSLQGNSQPLKEHFTGRSTRAY